MFFFPSPSTLRVEVKRLLVSISVLYFHFVFLIFKIFIKEIIKIEKKGNMILLFSLFLLQNLKKRNTKNGHKKQIGLNIS